jgi:hypothetical protein
MHIRKKTPGMLIGSLLLGTTLQVAGSSHREAPYISTMPALDGTDFYMFRSYEPGKQDFVTFIANYYPLQDAYGGPNYFNLEPEAVYEIHIDNNGDSREDITVSFDFSTILNGVTVPVGGQNVAIPLVNAGGIGPAAADTSAVNVRQEYTARVIIGERRNSNGNLISNAATGATTFRKPVDNIGAKSIADYEAYARDHIYTVTFPGCATNGRMFVGQRQEGFAVNIGPIFDLVNLDPLGAVDAVPNPLADKNVTSIAMEVPISCITVGDDPVIGAWTTASMAGNGNNFLQVSRLGFPLVNEVIIGLPDKDKFNRSEPRNDDQFTTYATNPTLPFLLELLFGDAGAVAPKNFPRTDVVQALTGVDGLNAPKDAPAMKVRGEMLRLNTSIAVTPAASQSNLGVLGGDLAGFPNGRRPGDDVVDAALRVMMGALNPDATIAPNNKVPFTDQTTVSAADFSTAFPYLNSPLAGSGSN